MTHLARKFADDIKSLEDQQQKLLDEVNKTLTNNLKDINKELPKFKRGLTELTELEEEKMALGVDGVAKQRRSLLKAVRALGDWVRYSEAELEEKMPESEVDLKQAKEWTYEEFKEWMRTFSKLVTNIDKERQKMDRTLGLDFFNKKRRAVGPFKKIRDCRNQLKELLQTDYQLVKILEDLHRLQAEVATLEDQLAAEEGKLREMEERKAGWEEQARQIGEDISKRENEGKLREYRKLKTSFQEADLEIGHAVNPFRKVFRQYTRSQVAGTYLIGVARQYEDETITTFLQDAEGGFQQIQDLLNDIIKNADQLKLKANLVHRCKQLLDRIEKGKLAELQKTYLDLGRQVEAFSEDSKILAAVEELDGKKEQIDKLNHDATHLGGEIENQKATIEELQKTIEERKERFTKIHTEGVNFVV